MAQPKFFTHVQTKRPSSSRFDLSHDHKLSCNMGTLVPVMIHEGLPGDRYKINTQGFVRFAPLRTPVMHRFNVTFHTWAVPHRIVWPEWNEWLYDPSSSLVPPMIQMNVGPDRPYAKIGTLADYMGLPVHRNTVAPIRINAIPFAAYQCIYHQRYRDQNLIPEFDYTLPSGYLGYADHYITLRNRSFEHDYFTSCLPQPQRGPDVEIPLISGEGPLPVYRDHDNPPAAFGWSGTESGGASGNVTVSNKQYPGGIGDQLYVDSADIQAEAASIRDLRRAFRLEEWLELSMRSGIRPKEAQRMYFGVDPGDARINDPEYICGAVSAITMEEIPNTAGEIDGLPQGNLAGKATGLAGSKQGYYFCREHCTIITIMNIQPVASYQDGVDRFLSNRNDQFDYFWPQFQNIGEQEVLSKEIYCDGSSADENTFGYIPRYAEYKFKPSRTSGEFRTTLAEWNFTRRFGSRPTLTADFIEAREGVSGSIRTDPFAVTDPSVEKCYVQVMNNIMSSRPLQYFGNPRL